MAKQSIKIIALLLLTIVTIASLTQCVLARSTDGKVDQATAADVTQFSSYGDESGAASSFQKIIGSVITIVQVIGTGVAIIMLIVLAIKYISAAPGDKADIKKHAVVYVVGAIVLFAASGILGIVKNFASNISAVS